MGCSRPDRAQAAIVAVLKWTLAAARMAWASISVIQSAAEGIAQSPAVAEEPDTELASLLVPESADDAEPPSLLELAVPSPEPSLLDEDDGDALVARRSFLAQPLPLKWMAGGANALRTGPAPHSGHEVGPSSVMPWTTSKRRPQAAQA